MRKIICFFVFMLSFENSFSQEIIQMKKEGGVFTMPCEVNGLSLRFIFDTGASDVSISLAEAIFMLKNGYLSDSDIIGSTSYAVANGDIVEGTTINLRKLKIGNKYLYNVKASIIHTNNAPLLMGQSALSKIGKFSFDYSNNTLIFGESNQTTYNGSSFYEIQLLLESNKIEQVFSIIQDEIIKYPKTQYAASLLLIKAQILTKIFGLDATNSRKNLEIGINALRSYNQSFEMLSTKVNSSSPDNFIFDPDFFAFPDDLKRYSIISLKDFAFEKGIERYNSKDYKMSYEFFNLAGEIDPTDTTVHYNAGFLANELGRTEDAKKHFSTLLDIEGYNKLNAYYFMIQILSTEDEDPEAAYAMVTRAKEEYPSDKDLSTYEVQLLLQLNKEDQALTKIKIALESDPNNTALLLRSGYLKEQAGDMEGALADYKKSVEVDPQFFEGNYYAAALLIEKAREILNELNGLSDEEWEKRSESMGKEANEYYADAVTYFESALEIKPEDTGIMEILFQIHTRLGNDSNAKKYNKKLIKLLGPNWMEG